MGGEGGAFLDTFLLLGGEALNFVDDGVDFLVERARGVLQGVEFALVGGDGDFLGAQLGLGLLEAGLEFGLFAEQNTFGAALLGDFLLKGGERAPAVR